MIARAEYARACLDDAEVVISDLWRQSDYQSELRDKAVQFLTAKIEMDALLARLEILEKDLEVSHEQEA